MGALTATNTRMLPSGGAGSGFHPIDLDSRCAKDGKGFAWDGQPPLSRHELLVVFVRCHEPPRCMLQQLQAQRVPFLVYQKEAGRCGNATGAPSGWSHGPGVHVRTLAHNLGRECSGYLRFIVEHYDDLPRVTAFLQMGALMHMPFPSALWANLRFLRGNATHPPPAFAALSKNAIEGAWPGPCESRQKLAAFEGCAGEYWRELARTADAPPGFLRFYANGLFAATRRRIRAHPRALYAAMLDRLEGRAPLRCVHPAASRGGLGRSREVPGWSREGLHGGYVEWSNSSRLVPAESDCLMLEKLWHVLLGEPAVMPLPAEYNAQLRNYGGGARVGHIVCKPGTPG